MKRESLSDWMIKDHREFIIKNVKAPLLKTIVKYSCRYPEPTHENCNKLNSHFFVDLFDEFLKRQTNPNRRELFKALRKCFIGEYEHDDPNEAYIDWLLLKIHEAILSRKIKLHPPDKYTVFFDSSEGGT